MCLSPDNGDLLARALVDLGRGLPVALVDDAVWHLAVAAECLSEARLAAMRDMGAPVLAITQWRASTLKARPYDGDLARIRLREDFDAAAIARLADPKDDLRQPLAGPHMTLREGSAGAHRAALRLLKSARLLPAALLVEVQEVPDGLTRLDVADVMDALDTPAQVRRVVGGQVPLALAESARVHVFRDPALAGEHVAVEIGRPDRDAPVLTRLHSACFTGDILGSLKCDCGPQLHAALAAMGAEGQGVLIYLDQEGRGIGLANKMRAYALQDQGFDTVDANHRLGFEDDERDFRTAAAILRELGFDAVRLMTNNPRKVSNMEKSGISVVERVPLAVGRTETNADYLDTKARRSGHLL